MNSDLEMLKTLTNSNSIQELEMNSDSDLYVIDDFRNIIAPINNPSSVLIAGDSYSQVIGFKIKKEIDSISLIGKTINIIVTPKSNTNVGETYIIDTDYIISSNNDNYIRFYWHVPPKVTGKVCDYLFCISFVGTIKIQGKEKEQNYIYKTRNAELRVENTLIYQNKDAYNQNLYEQYQINLIKTISEFVGKNYKVDNNTKGEIFNDYTHNIASGDYSHAEGESTTASGYCSHAEGYYNTASGVCSHAEGEGVTASEICSHAEGMGTTANGEASHAEGDSTTANGYCSHVEGYYNTASGYGSHAEGVRTTASETYSHAEGYYNTASGYISHAEGEGTTAETYALHTQGRYNKVNTGNSTTYSATNNAFVIGNGTSLNAKDNAFRVDFSGNVYGKSAFNSTGADYAEYFEWEDGNITEEDRIGYFVTFDINGKIKKATATDEILGIVSGTASIIGDAYEDSWNSMYIVDDYGRPIYEDVQITYPAVTKTVNDKVMTIREERTVTEKHLKLNPNYDNTQTYIPRSQRKEWSCVGTIGKIYIRDDGTCIVNQKCICNNEGIATISNNNTGWRVLERVSDNIIRIWFK